MVVLPGSRGWSQRCRIPASQRMLHRTGSPRRSPPARRRGPPWFWPSAVAPGADRKPEAGPNRSGSRMMSGIWSRPRPADCICRSMRPFVRPCWNGPGNWN